MSDETSVKTLGEALPAEITRVRDTVLPHYDEIPEGALGAMMIRQDLDRAVRALASGDVVAMIAAYKTLKDITG